MISITDCPIDILEVINSVADPASGAIDIFVGTTRILSREKKVTLLEYEAYLPMALASMEQIVKNTLVKWPVKKISIVHRIGKIEVGEASVVIAVSAVHRPEAFEACRHLIDTLKKDVPIWKKEFYEDGEMWLGMHGPGTSK